jgi:mxaJ protein
MIICMPRAARRRRWLGVLLMAWAGFAAAQAQGIPAELRVCADPDNLPYSRIDGSGFENRLAQLLADDWRVPLRYAWLPDRRGFVRKTLGERRCDVIMGVPVGLERVATTRAYYRSSYVLLQGASQKPLLSWADPRLAQLRIGVPLIGDDLAASPPGLALARNGATGNVVGFPLAGAEPVGQRIVRALQRGEIDAAFLWGPQAGYHAKAAGPSLRLTRFAQPAGLADVAGFEFAIAMGVRRGDAELRAALDDFIGRRRADIDRILAGYDVPRVDAP